MSKTSGSNLFKEPAQWPLLPPWWLLAAPRAAALLSVTSATLQNWRVRGEGPESVPPMYLKPTQGDPIYYRYADIRSWAATRVGLSFSLEDQSYAFLKEEGCPLAKNNSPVGSLARAFDHIFQFDRRRVQIGLGPLFFSGCGGEDTLWEENYLGYLDTYYSKQPHFRSPNTKPSFCGPFEFDIQIPISEFSHAPPA